MFDMLKAATGRRGEGNDKRKTSGGGWKNRETKDKDEHTHESHH